VRGGWFQVLEADFKRIDINSSGVLAWDELLTEARIRREYTCCIL
jgi:hypothetical protein